MQRDASCNQTPFSAGWRTSTTVNPIENAVLELRYEPIADLRGHADIPSEFEAHSVYAVSEGAHGFEVAERALGRPFCKNYDVVENPVEWSVALKAVQCIRISAFAGSDRVGGVIAAVATPSLVTWETLPNVAVLWDLRVAPAYRRQSVATSLLRATCVWARQVGCAELKVETQDTNPAACKFYVRSGFTLVHAQPGAYSEFPEESQLIWKKSLGVRPIRAA